MVFPDEVAQNGLLSGKLGFFPDEVAQNGLLSGKSGVFPDRFPPGPYKEGGFMKSVGNL